MARSVEHVSQALATSDLYFGSFRLESTKRLWRGTQPVAVRPRPLAVLRYLAERSGQLVDGEELLKRLWPGIYVTRTVLRVCMSELRQALGEDPLVPQFIETVGRHGYRFIAPLSTTTETQFLQQETQPLQQGIESRRLTTPFVGRERELDRLRELFERARRGECQITFLFGEPGIGKTTLVNRFLDQVRGSGQVLIGCGQCIDHYGSGEAYLPLLEAFRQLCQGPDGEQVVAGLRRYAPTWLAQFPGLMEASEWEALQWQVQGDGRERMLRELVGATEALATDTVLVLVVEDLQWSDPSTLDALMYLAQRQLRLYLVGTYRPTEVIVSGHPLRQVVQEMTGRQQCEELPLDPLTEAEVEAYLRQRFGQSAAITELIPMIYRRTDGNALFMVSFVDSLLQQGLLEEADGQVQLQGDLATVNTLIPTTLRQMILRQIESLPADKRQLLQVASVGGMTFTAAEVVEQTKHTLEEAEEIYDQFANRELVIAVAGITEWPDGTVAVQYRFRHALYQEVLYEQLGQGQRIRLHQQFGKRKEAGYGEQTREIALELAVHFTEGRDYSRAVRYYTQASETALWRGAYGEALTHCQTGIDLLERLPETSERQRQELTLRISLNAVLVAIHGYAAEELVQNLRRARELCQEMNEPMKLAPILVGLTRLHMMRADRTATEELVEEEYRLIERLHDPACLVQLHTQLGTAELTRGRHARAREHHAQVLKLYNPTEHATLGFSFGFDPVALALVMSGVRLWLSGWPEQAWQEAERAIAHAKELAQPFSLVNVLVHAAWVRQFRGEPDQAWALTQTLVTLEHEREFAPSVTRSILEQGCVLGQRGKIAEGLNLLTEGLAQYRATGTRTVLPRYLSVLAELYGQQGQVKEGLGVIAEAIQLTETHFDRFWAAEAYRIKGELLLQSSVQSLGSRIKKSPTSKVQRPKSAKTKSQILNSKSQEEAEACFLQAIEVARQQEAKSLELRAAMSLSRLWQQQGKQHEARNTLSSIYGWFTEGYDTKDLRETKALLDEFGG